MLIKKFSLSGVSDLTYLYTDPINLSRKWLDLHELGIFVNMKGGTSGVLSIVCEYTHTLDASGTTYVYLHNASGTSVVFSGNSVAGHAANGGVHIPLILGLYGVTDYMRPVPFMRFGYKSVDANQDFDLALVGS